MGSASGSVTVTAKRLLKDAVKKSGRHTTVQVAEEFARIQKPGETSTGLSSLFGLGEVPMKMYLTLVMLTRKPPHVLFRVLPDHYWAELLGYEELNDADPIPGNGTRRIKRAMTALEKAGPGGTGLITRTPIRGHGAKISVVHPPELIRAPWITIPIELWSRGWINVMSARALFVYLCLRLVLAGKPDNEGTQISSWDRERFAIKEDTWQRGIKELEALNLVRSAIDRVRVDRWRTDLHKRKVYYLNNTFLLDNDSPLKPVALEASTAVAFAQGC
jgi:hypothetical protein